LADDEEIYESYEKRIRDRLAAEEELDALDAKRKARELEADYNLERVNEFERQDLDNMDDFEDDDEMDEGAERALNLEKFECPLREWISEERTRREIQRRFKKFLQTYYEDIEKVAEWIKQHEHIKPLPSFPPHLSVKQPIYPQKIRCSVVQFACLFLLCDCVVDRAMCAANSSSLEVSYSHIAKVQSLLAIWLTDVPRDMLQIFDEVLRVVVLHEFPNYSKVFHISS